MPRAAEHLVLVDNVFGVGRHEDFAGLAEVEFRRLVAEELAVNRAPNETTVRVDVDLRNAEFRRREVLLFVDAAQLGDVGQLRRQSQGHLLCLRDGKF